MNDIINEYNNNLEIIKNNAENTYELINKLLLQEKIHGFKLRIKELASLERKIKDKNKYSKLEDITDIIGFRIITYLNSDVDKIFKIISENFIVDDVNTIDKRKKQYDEFGYKSLHVIFSYTKERESLPEYFNCNKYKYELQIRTILQHAWAEIEHDLGYKSDLQIPDNYKRTFYKISMLLEYADDEFEKITGQIKQYRNELEEKLKENNLNIAINRESYISYIKNNSNIKEINNEIRSLGYKVFEYQDKEINFLIFAEEAIEKLKFLNINNLQQLNEAILKYKDTIPLCLDIFNKSYPKKNPDESFFIMDAPISYLIYILISIQEEERIESFINTFYKSSSLRTGLNSIRDFLIKKKL